MNEIDKITKETVIGTRTAAKKKNPMVALGLSFPVIGAGQFYNGQYTKGVIQLGATIVGLGLTLSASGDNEDRPDGNLDEDKDDWMSVPGYLLLFGGAIWSLIDAPMSANRINQQSQISSYGHLFQLDGDRSHAWHGSCCIAQRVRYSADAPVLECYKLGRTEKKRILL